MHIETRKELINYLKKEGYEIIDRNVTLRSGKCGPSQSYTVKGIVFYDPEDDCFREIETKNNMNYELTKLKLFNTSSMYPCNVYHKSSNCFISDKVEAFIYKNRHLKSCNRFIEECESDPRFNKERLKNIIKETEDTKENNNIIKNKDKKIMKKITLRTIKKIFEMEGVEITKSNGGRDYGDSYIIIFNNKQIKITTYEDKETINNIRIQNDLLLRDFFGDIEKLLDETNSLNTTFIIDELCTGARGIPFSNINKLEDYYNNCLKVNFNLDEEEKETEEEETMDKNNNAYKGLIALGFKVNEEVKEVKETMYTKARIYSIEFNGKEIGVYTEQVNQYGGCPVEHMYYVDYYNDEDVHSYIMNHKINNEVEQEEISKPHSTNLVKEKEIKEEIDNNITIENNTNTNEEIKTMNKYNKEERAKQVVEKMGVEYKEGMTLDDLLNEGNEVEEQEPFEFINQVSILPSTQEAIDKGLDLLWDIEDLINKVDNELKEEEKIIDIVNELKGINYFMIKLDDLIIDEEQPTRI